MRSIVKSIAAFVLLLMIAIAGFVGGVLYVLYTYPVIIFSLFAMLMSIWFICKFIANRQLVVGEGEAVIVEHWGVPYGTLYYGEHSLPVGARVRARYLLTLGAFEGNEEEVHNCQLERLRIRSQFNLHISDPYAFHYRGGKKRLNVGWVNREALAEVVREFNQDDLWNCPFQVNHHVRLAINQQLGNFGLQVSEYRLEEVTWSLTNHKWRRNRSPLAIQGNEDYWRGEADLNLSY